MSAGLTVHTVTTLEVVLMGLDLRYLIKIVSGAKKNRFLSVFNVSCKTLLVEGFDSYLNSGEQVLFAMTF